MAWLKKRIPVFLTVFLAFMLTAIQPFSGVDRLVTDLAYSRLRSPSRDILLICIDEATLAEYGSFTSWSREKTAELLDVLYADEENVPAVVGIDVTFQGEHGDALDAALAAACGGDRNVVLSAALVIRGAAEVTTFGRQYNAFHITDIEYPYPALRENTTTGFANAFIATDGVSRYNMTHVEYNGASIPSFAFQVADSYLAQSGAHCPEPEGDSAGMFRFFYAGKSGEYPHVSMKRVLEGKVPASEFRGKIILVGAYASGMQDAYRGTADVGSNVYGVEIQANIIQSLLDGTTAINADILYHAALFAAFTLVLFLLAERSPLVLSLLLPIAGAVAHLLLGRKLAMQGMLISQLYSIVVFGGMVVYFVIKKYLPEARRRQLIKTFGKYMEPRLVEQLVKDNAIAAELDGRRRDVSVLFVDIRGFTSMSENLEPEQVVEILNAYLGLVTDCVFRNRGMLDKFIGDAAMAVFNAPVDQEDYLMASVRTAWEIAQGYQTLDADLQKRFGRSVSYGIGVHCGPAVVGNIGCDFRMDYTAIGDTVNTAARLEANAGRGEILISAALNQALAGRIQTESAGQMTFKGKSEPMEVYRVTGIGG